MTETVEVEQHYATLTVARMFDVTPETVRYWINNHQIKARKINGHWRIPHSEVVRLGTSRYGNPEEMDG